MARVVDHWMLVGSGFDMASCSFSYIYSDRLASSGEGKEGLISCKFGVYRHQSSSRST